MNISKISRRKFIYGGIGITTAYLTACQNIGNPNQNKNQNKNVIVATSTILGDWVRELLGVTNSPSPNAPVLRNILRPGDDPHTYEPVPADTGAIESATVIFYNGHHLEPNLIKLIHSNGAKVRALAVGELVKPLQLGKVADPHVWGSASNAVIMVAGMARLLGEVFPSLVSQGLEARLQKYQAQLRHLDTWIRGQIQTIPPQRRKLVTTHDAFQYYAQAYGLEVLGTLIGISTEEQPSAQTVKTLAQQIRQASVPTIFAETTINPALIKAVATEAQVNLGSQSLYSDSLGTATSDGATYIAMMTANTKAIVLGLGGQYTAFVPLA
jgi:manganese/iron transport system substrate-binding protein